MSSPNSSFSICFHFFFFFVKCVTCNFISVQCTHFALNARRIDKMEIISMIELFKMFQIPNYIVAYIYVTSPFECWQRTMQNKEKERGELKIPR